MKPSERLALEARANEFANVVALLHRGLCYARKGFAGIVAKVRKIADHENFRMSGNAAVRFDDDAIGAVEFGADFVAERHAERRSENSGGPEDGSRGNDFDFFAFLECHGVFFHVDNHRASTNSYAEVLEHAPGICRKIRGVAGQHAVGAFDENNAGSFGFNIAKVMNQCVVGNFAESAGQFRAGGAAADDDESHPGAKFRGITLALGCLERGEDAGAHRGCVVDGFQAGRKLLPFGMAKILMRGAGGDDQGIVFDVSVSEADDAINRVYVHGLSQQNAGIFLFVNDLAKRAGDVCGRERASGDLIQQRLE